MRGKGHTDETKAAVMASLLAGQRIGEVATAYRLPESTVRAWAHSNPAFAEVRAKKAADFDRLLSGYLEEVLVTLSVQAVAFRDTDWLKKQPASELAVLHGVLTDKAIRLFEAAQSVVPDTESAEGMAEV